MHTPIDPNPEGYEHEIIEFPIVLLDSKTLKIVDEFRVYVKPRDKPKLSAFCTRLTGITQPQVDGGVSLPEAMAQAHAFLARHGLVEGSLNAHVRAARKDKPEGQILTRRGDFKYQFAFATDGPWDLDRFLYQECTRKRIPRPAYYDMWVNVRKAFRAHQGEHGNISKMLGHFGMQFEGSPHSGLDDSKNIARIAVALARHGCALDLNDGIKYRPRYTKRRQGSKSSGARRGRRRGGQRGAALPADSSAQKRGGSGNGGASGDGKVADDGVVDEQVSTRETIEAEINRLGHAIACIRGKTPGKIKRRKTLYTRLLKLKAKLVDMDAAGDDAKTTAADGDGKGTCAQA